MTIETALSSEFSCSCEKTGTNYARAHKAVAVITPVQPAAIVYVGQDIQRLSFYNNFATRGATHLNASRSQPMTRFFFHIRDGSIFIEDPDGTEFEDLDAARGEALAAARDLLAARVKAGLIVDGQHFEITDAAGEILADVPLSSALLLP